MAKKYTVKKTDNLLELSQKFGTSPSNILKVNGLQTLTPGQTINIPVLRGFDGVDAGAGYETKRGGRRERNTGTLLGYSDNQYKTGSGSTAPTPAYGGAYNTTIVPPPATGARRTKGGNVNPMLARNQFAGIATGAGYALSPFGNLKNPFGNLENPFLPSGYVPINFPAPVSQRPTNVVNQPGFTPSQMVLPPTGNNGYPGFQTPTTNGFNAPPIYGNPFYMSPSANPALTTGGSLSGDKQGQVPALTPPAVSRAEGRAQFLSGEGINPNSGYIPTRADVWNMKANSRRKKMAKGESDDGGGGYSSAPAADPTLQNQGNYVNTAVSWRVG